MLPEPMLPSGVPPDRDRRRTAREDQAHSGRFAISRADGMLSMRLVGVSSVFVMRPLGPAPSPRTPAAHHELLTMCLLGVPSVRSLEAGSALPRQQPLLDVSSPAPRRGSEYAQLSPPDQAGWAAGTAPVVLHLEEDHGYHRHAGRRMGCLRRGGRFVVAAGGGLPSSSSLPPAMPAPRRPD